MVCINFTQSNPCCVSCGKKYTGLKKVHRLEKSTPKPLVALQTNISYVVLFVYGDMCYCEEERRGTVSGASKVGGLYKKSNIMYKNGTKNQKFQEIRKLI